MAKTIYYTDARKQTLFKTYGWCDRRHDVCVYVCVMRRQRSDNSTKTISHASTSSWKCFHFSTSPQRPINKRKQLNSERVHHSTKLSSSESFCTRLLFMFIAFIGITIPLLPMDLVCHVLPYHTLTHTKPTSTVPTNNNTTSLWHTHVARYFTSNYSLQSCAETRITVNDTHPTMWAVYAIWCG